MAREWALGGARMGPGWGLGGGLAPPLPDLGQRACGRRGASPHVAVQHHNYFIVLACFLAITLPSHRAFIVHCRMGSPPQRRGPTRARNDHPGQRRGSVGARYEHMGYEHMGV